MKKFAAVFLMFGISTGSYAALGTDQSTTFSKSIDANGRVWTISPGGTTDAGARLYRAVDNTGARSWATVAPSASSITRNLVRGANGLAVATAVAGIVGAAVDYLLDPANNQIKVTKNINYGPKVFGIAGYLTPSDPTYLVETPDKACSLIGTKVYKHYNSGDWKYNTGGSFGYGYCTSQTIKDSIPQIDAIPTPTNLPKPTVNVPFSDVANQIVNDSKSKPESKQYSDDAIDKDVQNNETTTINNITNQITNNYINNIPEPASDANPITNNNSTTVVNNTYNTTNNTYNQAEKFELPGFCDWASFLCDKQTQIEKNTNDTAKNTKDTADAVKDQTEKQQTFFDKILQSIKDIFAEPPNETTQVDIDDDAPQSIDTNISIAAQCPAPIVFKANYHGISSDWGVADFSPFCNILSNIIRPILIAMSSFSAVLIIGGVGVKENG